ncbi:MAG: hypothetical protein ACE5K4_04605 [Candidatus Hydrothermarchaeota archaeon]
MLGEEELLKESEKRIFSLGLGDTASTLSYLNMRYGIAKIIHVLRSYGIDKTETFSLLGPDATITRNYDRWMSGFGYGCIIHWPGKKYDKIIFPEVRPNACGMILAILNEALSDAEILEMIYETKKMDLCVNGVSIKWDLNKGNHFIEVLSVKWSRLDSIPEGSLLALIHTSASEIKHLLYNFENYEGTWEETPFGKCYVLEGKEAKKYYNQYRKLEAFSEKKRKLLLAEIFGDCNIICNPIHQGLFDANVMRLGVYDSTDKSTCSLNAPLFPLALGWDLPVILIRGYPNLSQGTVERLRFQERAEELGLEEFIKYVNVLPHGGGYTLNTSCKEVKAVQIKNSRYFKILAKDRTFILSNPREVPYTYRGMEVLQKIEECALGEPLAEFKQVCSFKV